MVLALYVGKPVLFTVIYLCERATTRCTQSNLIKCKIAGTAKPEHCNTKWGQQNKDYKAEMIFGTST